MQFTPIVIDKSLEEYIKDYKLIYEMSMNHERHCVYAVQNIWRTYLQFALNEIGSLRALWHLPKGICKRFGITYPCSVVGKIDTVHFGNFTLSFKILFIDEAVSDHFPNRMIVPLKDIQIIQEEVDGTDVSVLFIAEALHLFRVFSDFIWYPWDQNETIEEWLRGGLIQRLQLFTELHKASDLLHNAKQNVYKLLEDAKNLYRQLKQTAYTPSETSLLKHEVEKLSSAIYEMSLWEDPETRKSMNICEVQKTNGTILVITDNCTLQKYLDYLNDVPLALPIKYSTRDLQDGITEAAADDIVIITSGQYTLKHIGNLAYGGVIEGLRTDAVPVIMDDVPNKTFMEMQGGLLYLNHLKFLLENNSNAIMVLGGILNMRGVIMKSNRVSKIIIADDYSAQLIADHCDFYGITIVCFSRSSVKLTDCRFQDGIPAVKVLGGKLEINSCKTMNGGEINVEYCGDEHVYIH